MAYFIIAVTSTTPFGDTPATTDSACVCLGSTRAEGLAFSTSSNVAMALVREMKLLTNTTPGYCPYSTATELPPGPSQDPCSVERNIRPQDKQPAEQYHLVNHWSWLGCFDDTEAARKASQDNRQTVFDRDAYRMLMSALRTVSYTHLTLPTILLV